MRKLRRGGEHIRTFLGALVPLVWFQNNIPVPLPLIIAGGVGLLVLILLVAVVRKLRRRRTPRTADDEQLKLDVASLPDTPRPLEGPQLEYYHVPVRLAAVIIAPAGRGRQAPPLEQVAEALDEMAPGLGEIVQLHQPVIRRWPEQLSTSGFTQRFFMLAMLPGDRGKGSPWCEIAGRFEAGGESYLAGLVCRSDTANNLSQVAVTRPSDWLDVLRVRR